jgi:hypothetical protein
MDALAFFLLLMTGRNSLLVCTTSLRCSALFLMFAALFISLGFSSLRYQVPYIPPEPPPRAWCEERQAGRQLAISEGARKKERKEGRKKVGLY